MGDIYLGNAPCSWGTLEFSETKGEQIPYKQMLDELAETGYIGTELGDWGYMPTATKLLQEELLNRNLTMLGAFVPVALKDPESHKEGEKNALRVANLLKSVASKEHQPFLVLADDNGTNPIRTKNAGRITPEMGLSEKEWQVFAEGAERIAKTVKSDFGLATVFHHHCAGYIETPEEIDRLLSLTDPELLGLVFDTGHYVYGCGGKADIKEALERYKERIWYMHFKDCHPLIAKQAKEENWDYFKAISKGIFCQLGQGNVDFPSVLHWLQNNNYKGWIVVEQDILPGMGSPKESAEKNRKYLRTIGL